MKIILSFLFLYLVFFGFAEDAVKTNFTFSGGIKISQKYFQSVYYINHQDQYKNTWGLQIKPLNFLSFSCGHLNYGGLWARFTSSGFTSMSALKSVSLSESGLHAALPTASSEIIPPSISLAIAFPTIHINAFLEFPPYKKTKNEADTDLDNKTDWPELGAKHLGAGFGISIPFSIGRALLIPKGIKAEWTAAWRQRYITKKNVSSWFMPQPFFAPNYFNSLIQEIKLQGTHNTLLVNIGFTESPYGSLSLFTKAEYSLALKHFVLNARLFVGDIDYLNLKGQFSRKTAQIAANPQLVFSFPKKFVRSIKLGFLMQAEHIHSTALMPQSLWYADFKFAFEIRMIPLLVFAEADIGDLIIENIQDSIYPMLTENSLLKVQTKLGFYPWYGKTFARNWTVDFLIDLYPQKRILEPQYKLGAAFSGSIAVKKLHAISLAAKANFIIRQNSFYRLDLSASLGIRLKTKFFNSRQQTSFSIKTDSAIKEKHLQSVDLALSLMLQL